MTKEEGKTTVHECKSQLVVKNPSLIIPLLTTVDCRAAESLVATDLRPATFLVPSLFFSQKRLLAVKTTTYHIDLTKKLKKKNEDYFKKCCPIFFNCFCTFINCDLSKWSQQAQKTRSSSVKSSFWILTRSIQNTR